jgi:hypothetical protein
MVFRRLLYATRRAPSSGRDRDQDGRIRERLMNESGSTTHRTILALLDEAFDSRAWHGTNLRGSLRRLTAEEAAWRPAAGRHNIWEIVIHAAYWKYAVRRRLTGEKRGSFSISPGSNWFTRPEILSGEAWRADVEILRQEHIKLREAVSGLSPDVLEQPVGKGLTAAGLIRGIAAHDLYHAGQIQLLKRLMRPRP